MGSDPFFVRLEELDQAALELAERLGRLREAIAEIRRERAAGRRVSEIVASGTGPPARREVRASWSRVNQALHEYRVQAVKELVDGEGMSIADAARTTGNARQVTSRLYHAT
jgi:hypothetical protein